MKDICEIFAAFIFIILPAEYVLLILERGEGRARETLIGCFLYMAPLKDQPTTYVGALTGKQTGSLSVHGIMLQTAELYQPGLLPLLGVK